MLKRRKRKKYYFFLCCGAKYLGVVLICFLNTQRLHNVVFNNCVSKKECLKQFPLMVTDLFLETGRYGSMAHLHEDVKIRNKTAPYPIKKSVRFLSRKATDTLKKAVQLPMYIVRLQTPFEQYHDGVFNNPIHSKNGQLTLKAPCLKETS